MVVVRRLHTPLQCHLASGRAGASGSGLGLGLAPGFGHDRGRSPCLASGLGLGLRSGLGLAGVVGFGLPPKLTSGLGEFPGSGLELDVVPGPGPTLPPLVHPAPILSDSDRGQVPTNRVPLPANAGTANASTNLSLDRFSEPPALRSFQRGSFTVVGEKCLIEEASISACATGGVAEGATNLEHLFFLQQSNTQVNQAFNSVQAFSSVNQSLNSVQSIGLPSQSLTLAVAGTEGTPAKSGGLSELGGTQARDGRPALVDDSGGMPTLSPAQLARMAASKEAAKQRRALKKANLSLEMSASIAAKRQAARFRKAAKAAEQATIRPVDLRSLTACPETSPPSTRPQPVAGAGQSKGDGSPKVNRRWGAEQPDAIAAWPDDKSLSLLDDWHRKHGLWAIDTANPNSWSSGAMSGALYMELSAADVILTQEVKVPHGHLKDQAEQAARNSKWSLAIEPCEVTQLGGHSAGTAVAVRSFIGMSESIAVTASKHLHAHGHFSMKRVSAMGKGGVHCGAPYPHSMVGNGGSRPSATSTSSTPSRSLSGLVGPWILGGDWNCTPAELEATGWLQKVGGVIHGPSVPTCNESVYDLFVVAAAISDQVHSCHVIGDAGMTPHSPPRLFFKGTPRKTMIRVIRAPQSIPAVLPHGPMRE